MRLLAPIAASVGLLAIATRATPASATPVLASDTALTRLGSFGAGTYTITAGGIV